MVYRTKIRTDDGRIITRLRQETHATKAAAEARVAELNVHRHTHTTDPAEQRKRGRRSLADWLCRLAGVAAREGCEWPPQSAHEVSTRPGLGWLAVVRAKVRFHPRLG